MMTSANRIRSLPLVALGVAALLAEPAAAGLDRWTGGGPAGGSIFALAFDPQTPTTLYAGTYGVARSTDGGETWVPILSRPAQPCVALAIDPQTPSTLYVGTSEVFRGADSSGVLRSTDGGETWAEINHGLTASQGNSPLIHGLAIDPQNPSLLYAAVEGEGYPSGMFRSTDGGDSWTAINDGLETNEGSRPVYALAMDPETPSTLYAGTAGGVFRSTDGGDSWTAINNGIPIEEYLFVIELAIDPRNPSTVYAGTIRDGIFRSTDGGDSWAAAGGGLHTPGEGFPFILDLAVDSHDSSRLYAATRKGVFRSVDGGGAWETDPGRLSSPVSVLAAGPQAPGLVYAGTVLAGVFRSTDGGETWTASAGGPRHLAVSALAFDPGPESPVALLAATAGGVFRSTDGGESWMPRNLGLDPVAVGISALAVDPETPSNLYLVGTEPGVLHGWGAAYRSQDGGETWTGTRISSLFALALAIDPETPSTLFVGTESGILRSTDGGDRFASVFDVCSVSELEIAPSDSSWIYATCWSSVGGPARLFRSTDGGDGWREMNDGMPAVRSLAVDPEDPSLLHAGTFELGVLRSTDGGVSWTPTRGLDGARVEALLADPRSSTTLYAGTEARGVYRSIDRGMSWWPIPGGLTAPVNALAIEPPAVDPPAATRIYAGTGEGVFDVDLVTTLALHGGRFRVEVDWREYRDIRGRGSVVGVPEDPGGAVALRSRDSAVLEFFGPDNWELLVKVLDGRALTDHFWVFSAAATNVEVALTVTDTACGDVWTYVNPLGRAAPAVTDVEALPGCASPATPSCVADADTVCLGAGGRFQVEAVWRDFVANTGSARQVEIADGGLAASDDSGLFYFFDGENWELLVKVLDGCRFNSHFWVFAAATTDVEYELRITDTATGDVRTYQNPLGVDSPALNDVEAFAICDTSPPS